MREFPPPQGSENKPLFYALSVIGWLAFAVLLLLAGTSDVYWWTRFWLIVVSICCAVAGAKFYKAGGEADQKEAENMASRAKTREQEVLAKQAEVKRRNVELETVLEAELNQVRRRTEAKRLETEQATYQLEQALIEVGQQQGLRPDDVSQVNRHKYLKEIDLESRWKEITQDLDAGDIYIMADQQLVHKLTSQLEEWVRTRHRISTSSDPQEVKAVLLARYDKNIRYLEDKLDAQQAGLLSPENRQEARRITAGYSNSGSSSSEEI